MSGCTIMPKICHSEGCIVCTLRHHDVAGHSYVRCHMPEAGFGTVGRCTLRNLIRFGREAWSNLATREQLVSNCACGDIFQHEQAFGERLTGRTGGQEGVVLVRLSRGLFTIFFPSDTAY
jgi:hypothetical protein